MKTEKQNIMPDDAENLRTDGAEGQDHQELVPSELTAAQIEELKAKAAKADDCWERLLRQTADFENFKKRSQRERQDAIKYANESMLEKLVPVLDNFDMALAAADQSGPTPASVESLRSGVNLIYNQLRSVLTDAGLEEVDARDQPFDPNWQEAVSQQESEEVPEGHVLKQLRKGYRLKDRLLRPASVVVSAKPR